MGRRIVKTIMPVFSDMHSGSTTGFMAPSTWVLRDEGGYKPSPAQRKLFALGLEIAQEVKHMRQPGERIIAVHNGDAIDGNHHATTQLVTGDKDIQQSIHIDAMEKILTEMGWSAEDGDLLYYTIGTECHVNSYEHRISKDLGGQQSAKGNNQHDGSFAWTRLILDVNRTLFDFAHHGFSPGNLPHTRGNAIRSKLRGIYTDRTDRKKPLPVANWYISSHNHQYRHEMIETNQAGIVHGIITPALQGRTHYIDKVATRSMSDLGGLIFDIAADGTTKMRDDYVKRIANERITKV